jgi:hypothetical protein
MKVCIQINKATGSIESVTACSVDTDINFVLETADLDVLEVPNDHPAIYEQKDWEAKKDDIDGKRKLQKKQKVEVIIM